MTELPIAVSGPPGSGKSTAGRRAAERLKLEYASAGELFRAEAARRGLDLAAFSRLAEEEPSIDRQLDDTMLKLARPGRLIDGRVTGALCRRRGIPVRYIRITAGEEVRAARLAERDGMSVGAALEAARAREASERRRYWRYYEIDLDREPPDHAIDSTSISADEVAGAIVRFVRSAGASDGR